MNCDRAFGTRLRVPTFLSLRGVNLLRPPPDKRPRTSGFKAMNNSTLTSADSATHLKIVVVSLLAGILVVGVGIAARPALTDSGATASRLDANGPVIRAGKPVIVTTGDTTAIR